jgi:GT2 family glycosyltransferase
MESKVGVVILNWNGKDDTLECLESVYKIDYPHFEVIVVDNASTDGSVEAIKSKFPQSKVIVNAENRGFCGGNNIGIKQAIACGAEYVFALNNDTVVKPLILKELKEALDSDQRIGAVSPYIAFYQKPERVQFDALAIDWGNGDTFGKHPGNAMAAAQLLDTDFVTWCAVLFHKRIIERVGYLDERFFAYYEDVDWSVRLKKAGLSVKSYREVLVHHKASQSTGGAYSASVYFFLFRNRMLFMRKHARLVRKLQFSITYVHDALRTYTLLKQQGNREAASSVMDAFWSAVQGAVNQERFAMPDGIKTRLTYTSKFFLWFLTCKAVFKTA